MHLAVLISDKLKKGEGVSFDKTVNTMRGLASEGKINRTYSDHILIISETNFNRAHGVGYCFYWSLMNIR